MKMVKSLLLGSAAGLVAVTAQAADLPVKVKAVEYVKICSLYGAGFYYMPGTDLCMKVGGWVRAEAGYGVNGNQTWGGLNANANQRTTSNFTARARGYITADVRNQTEYGTVRGYIAVGLSTNDIGLNTAANQFSANRAFVQFGGMTAGLAQSFYDFYSVPATSYWGQFPASDTGDGGWWVWGYTFQFGGGFSATIADEARRTTQLIDQNAVVGLPAGTGGGTIIPGSYFNALTGTANTTTGATGTVSGGAAVFPGNGAYGGQQFGDIVGNLRVDQAWGAAQVMGALHQVNASYYSTTGTGAPAIGGGHPNDVYGWAAGFGFKVFTPFIGQGDYLQTQFNVTQGALRYIFNTPNTNWGVVNGGREAFGVLSDGVYGGTVAGGTATSISLTSAWGFNAAYEHFWVPNWRTSVYGGYDQIRYGTQANAMLCTIAGFGTAAGAVGSAAGAAAGCNNNWSLYFIGTRTQWDVSKTFYIGVDVLYEDMKSGTTSTGGTGGYGFGSALLTESHGSDWMVRVRAHRDFLP